MTDQPVTRQYRTDSDTYALVVDGVTVGTVDPTRDWSGDVRAHRASGEIVAPRFHNHADAEAYLTGSDRPAMCLASFPGAIGDCVRQVGHYGPHMAAGAHLGNPHPVHGVWTDEQAAEARRR